MIFSLGKGTFEKIKLFIIFSKVLDFLNIITVNLFPLCALLSTTHPTFFYRTDLFSQLLGAAFCFTEKVFLRWMSARRGDAKDLGVIAASRVSPSLWSHQTVDTGGAGSLLHPLLLFFHGSKEITAPVCAPPAALHGLFVGQVLCGMSQGVSKKRTENLYFRKKRLHHLRFFPIEWRNLCPHYKKREKLNKLTPELRDPPIKPCFWVRSVPTV